MKNLTMNRLAFAGIKANKKDYFLLCVGVFLAVFFAVGTLLGLDILFQKYQHRADIPQTETTFEAVKSVLSLNASLALAGTFLLLAATLGIFSASGGQFQRKEEQYRMLRTIGATRRQIRAISSREAVVLALLTAPLGCLSALLFVEILRKLFPESLPYPARPVWLLVGCLGALLLVWLAARLPALVYRPRNATPHPVFPLRSRKTYRLPTLWNGRALRFHPFRSGCAMVLIALFCLAAVLFADGAHSLMFLTVEDSSYMEIRPGEYPLATGYFSAEPGKRLTPEAVETLSSLSGVKSVSGEWYANAITLTDHVGSYFPLLDSDNPHLKQYRQDLFPEEERQAMEESRTYQASVQAYHLLQEFLGTQLIPYSLKLVVVNDPETLTPYLVSGSIDREALDRGTAVLADLPTLYLKKQGDVSSFSTRPEENPDAVYRNDQIFVGDTLPLLQLCLPEESCQGLPDDPSDVELLAHAEIRKATATVCGTLSHTIYGAGSGAIIATPKGLEKMGLSCPFTRNIHVELTETASPEETAAIRNALEELETQEEGLWTLDPTNNKAINLASCRRRLLFLGGVTGMFLLLAILEIQGDLRRQLRAEQRSLGILRAVGCDERTLSALYARQICIFALGGGLLALGLYGLGQLHTLAFDFLASLFWSTKPQVALPTLLATAAALLGINIWLLKRELGRFVQSSVIENIREE